MFPFDIDEENMEQKEEPIFKEYEIDFKTGQLTGRTVEGLEAIKVWVYLALLTPRYRFEQYSWNYGSEIEELIGLNIDEEYLKSEVQRRIEDCILINEHIQGIENLECSFFDDKLTASFRILTDYGEVEMNV